MDRNTAAGAWLWPSRDARDRASGPIRSIRSTTTRPYDPLDRGALLVGCSERLDRGVRRSMRDWIGLNPANGQPRGQPIDLGFVPVRPVQHADLDGDGESEVLALGPGPSSTSRSWWRSHAGTGGQVWAQTIRAKYGSKYGLDTINPPPDWPLIVDLDGDGRSEIVVADSGPMPKGDEYRGVRLLDGASGIDRWVRPLHPKAALDPGEVRTMDWPRSSPPRILTAMARATWSPSRGSTARNYLDLAEHLRRCDLRQGWAFALVVALGLQGGALASVRHDQASIPVGSRGKRLADARGSAGRRPRRRGPARRIPTLIVSLRASTSFPSPTARSCMRSTGSPGPGRPTLTAMAWKTFGAPSTATCEPTAARCPKRGACWGVITESRDLDGDGIADVISDDLRVRTDIDESSRKTLTAAAHSGRDGRLLWRSRLDYQGPWLELMRERAGLYALRLSLFPAAILTETEPPRSVSSGAEPITVPSEGPATLPLEVLSGRSGRPLWSAGPFPLGFDMTNKLLRDREHRSLRSASLAGRWTSSCGTTDSMCRPARSSSGMLRRRIAWPAYPGETDM